MQKHVIQLKRPLTGEWDSDQPTVREFAETPTTAAHIYHRAQAVMALFDRLTYGTPSAPSYPERSGLARKVHDELFPIAHFAHLHFCASDEVSIHWHLGNQSFDATVEDRRTDSDRSSIRYLEVTTLQDGEDAKLLKRLANEGTVCIEGDHRQVDHFRKVELLRTALKKKSEIKYPPETALLVYTDEDRARTFSFGTPRLVVHKKNSFGKVLHEMQHLLTGFSEVFVYSRNEIYCSLPPRKE